MTFWSAVACRRFAPRNWRLIRKREQAPALQIFRKPQSLRAGSPSGLEAAIRSCSGLTVIEMLVSTTLLAVIVIGLTAMFVETQRAFKAGVRQSTTADAGRTVIEMVGNDLSQASDAGMLGVTNLFWSWFTSNYTYNYQDLPANVYRTNQQQEIFVLVHTNTEWMGIGYAVSNWAPGVGTLYRYLVSTNTPQLTNNILFDGFDAAAGSQQFGPHFDRVADGVIHLKIRAFDRFGNEFEEGEDYAYANAFYEFGYPAAAYTNDFYVPAAGLPNSIQLEVGVLEPETFEQLRAVPAGSPAQKAFLGRAGGHIQIFRQNIPIAAASR